MRIHHRAFFQQERLWDLARDGSDAFALRAQLFKGFLHPPLQMQSTIKNQIRFEDSSHIVSRGLEKMRVYPLDHQCRHLHTVSPDLTHQITHHPRRAHHIHLTPEKSRNP